MSPLHSKREVWEVNVKFAAATKWFLFGAVFEIFVGIIVGFSFPNDFWHRVGTVLGRFGIPVGVQV